MEARCDCGAEMVKCEVKIPGERGWRRGWVCLKCEAGEQPGGPQMELGGFRRAADMTYRSVKPGKEVNPE